MTGFPSTLTSGQLTVVRQPNQRFRQYLLVSDNDIIWQTQPAAAVDGATPYISFTWDGTDQGDRTNVYEGMTVYFSTTSDVKASAFFRGRVRLAPDATTFYVNETSANLTATDYVTVIDDYALHERIQRDTTHKDGDLTFQQLPPTISGLQSAYFDDSGAATVSWSFAPTVTANAAGATISSYQWYEADGTITVGVSTDKNVTIQFPGAATNEQRWVRFEATDSNGVTGYFVFQVFTVDSADATPTCVLLTADQVRITHTVEEGQNATISAWAGVSDVLDQTRVVIASVDNYNGCKALAFTSGGTYEVVVGDTIEGATGGAMAVVVAIDLDSGTWAGGDAAGTLWINQQSGTFEAENLDVGVNSNVATIAADSINTPMNTNIQFIGRLRTETDDIRGDIQYANLQETQFTIEGIATELAHIVGPGLPIVNDTTPTAWNEIKTMTIGRIMVFALAWHTTFLNLCSFTMASDIHDYEWFEPYNLPPAPGLEWINSIANAINAQMAFAPDGACTIQRHASYAGTGGLDTILTLQVNDSGGNSDLEDWSLDFDYVPTNAQAIVGAATYNTTTSKVIAYRAQAPAQQYGPGWGTTPLNGQIMKSDLTQAAARTEGGSRVGSHLAYTNPHELLTGTLRDGLWFLVSCSHQLYAFEIAAGDNTRGRVYTSSDKWLLREIGYGYNPLTGRYEQTTASFEIVTTGGNYGILVDQIVDVNDLGYPPLPPIGAGLQPIDPLSNYPVDDPDYTLPGIGGELPQPGNSGLIEPGCEMLNVSMRTGSVKATTNNTVFGETYLITVEGDAEIFSGNWMEVFDFTTSDGDFTVWTDRGIWSNGNGWGQNAGVILGFIQLETPIIALTSVNYAAIVLSKAMDGADRQFQVAEGGYGGTQHNVGLGGSASGSQSFAPALSVTKLGIGVANTNAFPYKTYTGYIETITLAGTGSNPFHASGGLRGDAFYFNYDTSDGDAQLYSGSNGFRIDAAKPASIPVYNSSHQYQFIATGTGSPFGFDYVDSDYSDNQNRNLVVTVCGPGMAMS